MNREERSAGDLRQWTVLMVDDEPEVHDVSRLILGGLIFEGLEVELLSAYSAAEARAILARRGDVALVLLDVVMETDDAGLGLVQHIREQLGDSDMQIVLRTGQPGMAPERDVVLRYEINGYSLKTDITAQRLHSIVISALRSYRNARALRVMLERDARQPSPAAASSTPAAHATQLAQVTDAGAMLVHAQPEIVLASNQVAGFELVPRWRTSMGLLSADRVCEAIPAGPARRRLVRELLAQACSWSAAWRALVDVPLTVSIPVVGESLGDRETLQAVVDTVRAAAMPRGALDLLVSEATLLGGRADIRAAVATLRSAGLTFTLADFGAQTISLQRLNQMAPDRLKLHRLFVRGVVNDPDRKALARSLIALAQTLNIVAIADGIADDGDAQFFRWEGCDLAQGDALAPACGPADVADFLRREKRTRS
jgi:EAL domain-containing protein (putative c-di-GMP-specific phosphodiesterase class I)